MFVLAMMKMKGVIDDLSCQSSVQVFLFCVCLSPSLIFAVGILVCISLLHLLTRSSVHKVSQESLSSHIASYVIINSLKGGSWSGVEGF